MSHVVLTVFFKFCLLNIQILKLLPINPSSPLRIAFIVFFVCSLLSSIDVGGPSLHSMFNIYHINTNHASECISDCNVINLTGTICVSVL